MLRRQVHGSAVVECHAASQADVPGVGLFETRKHLERHSLACTGRAEQNHDFVTHFPPHTEGKGVKGFFHGNG
jgi:hypothetical protein